MKSYLLILLVLVFSFTAFGQGKEVIVTAKQVNIRETPSIKSKVVGTAIKGNTLIASANEGNWYYVTFGKVRGWVHYTTIAKKDIETDFDELAGYFNVNPPKQSKSLPDLTKYSIKDEWIKFAAGSATNFYYNPSRTTRDGSLIQVWIKEVSQATFKDINKIQYEINCQQQKLRSLLFVEYKDNGEVRQSWSTPNSYFNSAIPDSIGEALVFKVCR